jgi:hypothetical protein
MGLQAQPETPKERSHDSEHGKNGYRWFQSANKGRLKDLDTRNQQRGTQKFRQNNFSTINDLVANKG